MLHRRGDFEHVKPILRRAVDALAVARGDEAAETTPYAWALFDTKLKTADSAAATVTRERFLDWLIATPDDRLTAEQHRIRADVFKRATK